MSQSSEKGNENVYFCYKKAQPSDKTVNLCYETSLPREKKC